MNCLRGHAIEAVTPDRDHGSGPKAHDREANQDRLIIERTTNRLKRYRWLAGSSPRNCRGFTI